MAAPEALMRIVALLALLAVTLVAAAPAVAAPEGTLAKMVCV